MHIRSTSTKKSNKEKEIKMQGDDEWDFSPSESIHNFVPNVNINYNIPKKGRERAVTHKKTTFKKATINDTLKKQKLDEEEEEEEGEIQTEEEGEDSDNMNIELEYPKITERKKNKKHPKIQKQSFKGKEKKRNNKYNLRDKHMIKFDPLMSERDFREWLMNKPLWNDKEKGSRTNMTMGDILLRKIITQNDRKFGTTKKSIKAKEARDEELTNEEREFMMKSNEMKGRVQNGRYVEVPEEIMEAFLEGKYCELPKIRLIESDVND